MVCVNILSINFIVNEWLFMNPLKNEKSPNCLSGHLDLFLCL